MSSHPAAPSGAALAASMLALMLAASPARAAADNRQPSTLTFEQTPVVLPAIISRWASDDDATLPGLTIEELGRCMTRRTALDRETGNVEARAADMQRDSEFLSRDSAALDTLRNDFAAGQSRLAMQQQEYDRQQRTLDGERAAISALAAKPQPPKEAQALAARIARFNVQVDAQNRRAAALNKGAESGQAEHDLLVARIDAYNARVDAINASRKALLADSSALAAKLAAYQAGCVGERQLLGK